MEEEQNWAAFEAALSLTLEHLPEDAFLILNVSGFGNRFVQFANGGDRGFRLEAVADTFVEPDEQIGDKGREQLRSFGWLPPDPAPEGPRSNVNHYREWPNPAPYEEIARMGVQALREVYAAEAPGMLTYFSNDKTSRLLFPLLGIKFAENQVLFEPNDETTLEELEDFVEAYLQALTGDSDLKRDDDGDFAFRAGSAAFFVRLLDTKPPKVRVFAPLIWGVEESFDLLRAVNEVSFLSRTARVFWTADQVIAVTDIPAPFVSLNYLQFVCDDIAALADHFDDVLRERFSPSTGSTSEDATKPTTLPGYL